MENLYSSFSVVYPMLVMMLAGMLIRKSCKLTDAGIKEMNGLIYKLFFPAMIYTNVINSDIGEAFDLRLILYALILITVVFLSLMVLVPKLNKIDAERGVLVQGLFRSNFLVFGMSIVQSLYGADKLGPATLLAAITIPYMNALSVVDLEIFRGGKPNAWKITKRVFRNPVIIWTIAGFLFKLIGFNPCYEAVNSIAKIGTPFALVVIGASFKPSNVKKYSKQLTWGLISKLVIVPLFAVIVCALAGFRDELLITIMCLFGGPCATASYAMAQQMDGDGDLAALLVMFTSVLCVVSFFLWIFALKTLGLA